MRTRLALPLILAACAAAPMTPAEDYAASYVGLYGPTNLCRGQEVVVSLATDRFGLGETSCAIGSVTRAETGITDVGLNLSLTGCAAEGTPVPNFSVRLLQTQAGLTLASPTSNLILQRCTDL
jgi:hypothetical protein